MGPNLLNSCSHRKSKGPFHLPFSFLFELSLSNLKICLLYHIYFLKITLFTSSTQLFFFSFKMTALKFQPKTL